MRERLSAEVMADEEALSSGCEGLGIGPLVSRAGSNSASSLCGGGRRCLFFTHGSDQPIRPSIAVWRDHSTGASRRRVTPMPRGNRPSIAAFTRSGARKARDIVMLTWRTLHPSRLAMRSTSAFASTTSSLSQRRPRAIDAIKVARVSDRIGRTWCGGSEAGRSISRRRVTGVLRHGTSRVSASCARSRLKLTVVRRIGAGQPG